jgi:hypothetical protein
VGPARRTFSALVVGLFLMCTVMVLPGAAEQSMDSFLFYSPGNQRPTGVIMWPDYSSGGQRREAATFFVTQGMSATDPTRAAQAGEQFYIRVDFSQHAPNALMSFNAAPKVDLPVGLVRADDRFPVRCAAILPPRTS